MISHNLGHPLLPQSRLHLIQRYRRLSNLDPRDVSLTTVLYFHPATFFAQECHLTPSTDEIKQILILQIVFISSYIVYQNII